VVQASLQHCFSLLYALLAGGAGVASPLLLPSLCFVGAVVQVSLHHWSSLLPFLLAGGAGVASPLVLTSFYFVGGWCRRRFTTGPHFFLFCWRVVQASLLHWSFLLSILLAGGAGVTSPLFFPSLSFVGGWCRHYFSTAPPFVFFCCMMVQASINFCSSL
jgi:hypothetical protein